MLNIVFLNIWSIIEFQRYSSISFFVALALATASGLILILTKYARFVPNNYLLLFLFTSCTSYLINCLISGYVYDFTKKVVVWERLEVVLAAALATILITLILTLMAFSSWFEENRVWYFVTLVTFVGLISYGLCLCFDLHKWNFVIMFIVILLYSLYILFDVEMLFDAHKLNVDDYVKGVVYIYFDVLRLFVEILRLIMVMKKEDWYGWNSFIITIVLFSTLCRLIHFFTFNL